MKPHIRLIRGIWVCQSLSGGVLTTGDGYTPDEAYRDWLSVGGVPCA